MTRVTQRIVGIVFHCNDSVKDEIDLYTKDHGCKLWSTENIDEVSLVIYQVEVYTTSSNLLFFLMLKYANYFKRFICLSTTNKEASL